MHTSLQDNQDKLVTGFDFYETLRHISSADMRVPEFDNADIGQRCEVVHDHMTLYVLDNIWEAVITLTPWELNDFNAGLPYGPQKDWISR